MKRWAAGVAVVGTMVMTWPLALQVGQVRTSGRAEGDLGWSILMHRWAGELWTGRASLWGDPRVGWPDGGDLPSSAWNLVALLGTGWLQLFTTEPHAGWHLAVLLVGVLNGLAGGVLGRVVGGRTGTWAGAAMILALPWPWMELLEGRLEQGLVAPIALWLAAAWHLRSHGAASGAWGGAALGLVAATYWFMGPLAGLAGLAVWGLPRRKQLGPFAGALAVVVGLALLPLVPALVDGAQAAAVNDGVFSRTQRLHNSVLVSIFAVGPGVQRVPALVWLLALCGLSHPAGRRLWVAAAVGAVWALGPVLSVGGQPVLVGGYELTLPLSTLDVLPGFERFWWPERAGAIVGVAMAGAAVVGARRVPVAWVVVAVVLGLLDGRHTLHKAVAARDADLPTSPLDPPPMGAFFALPAKPELPGSGPLLVLPWGRATNAAAELGVRTGRPLLLPDGAADARLRSAAFAERVAGSALLTTLDRGGAIDPSTLVEELEALGVDTVVWLGPDAPPLVTLGAPTHTGELTAWSVP